VGTIKKGASNPPEKKCPLCGSGKKRRNTRFFMVRSGTSGNRLFAASKKGEKRGRDALLGFSHSEREGGVGPSGKKKGFVA